MMYDFVILCHGAPSTCPSKSRLVCHCHYSYSHSIFHSSSLQNTNQTTSPTCSRMHNCRPLNNVFRIKKCKPSTNCSYHCLYQVWWTFGHCDYIFHCTVANRPLFHWTYPIRSTLRELHNQIIVYLGNIKKSALDPYKIVFRGQFWPVHTVHIAYDYSNPSNRCASLP